MGGVTQVSLADSRVGSVTLGQTQVQWDRDFRFRQARRDLAAYRVYTSRLRWHGYVSTDSNAIELKLLNHHGGAKTLAPNEHTNNNL